MTDYPKVVALDTDWTIWQEYLDSASWGKGPGAQALAEDNIERVDRQLLRDRTDHNKWIRVFDDISGIVNDILKRGAKVAIVSRNPSKSMCDRALYYFNTINPSDGKEWSIIHLVTYDEVIDQSKVQHFRRIRAWSTSDFSDLLLFDDEAYNNIVRIEVGVTFQVVRDRKGLTWEAYRQGIDAWQRAKNITIPSSLGPVPMLVGFSGLPASWVELVRRGEGRVDRNTPYRWGYALYIADTIAMAKYFTTWNDDWMAEKSKVCEVWVKDYDVWAKMNKVWIPEHSGILPQMNNTFWSVEEAGWNQEDRDLLIADRWKVYTPYVLFSKHHWMEGMPIPRGERWTEMVVYTQIQRSLFEVVQLPDDQVDQHPNPSPFPLDRQVDTWTITVPDETRQEFRRYGEPDPQ